MCAHDTEYKETNTEDNFHFFKLITGSQHKLNKKPHTKNKPHLDELAPVTSVVDPDQYWIRIQELCGSGSTHKIK